MENYNKLNCLSLVFETEKIQKGSMREYYKIYVQALDNPKNRKELLERARTSTFNGFDHGRFTEAWRLYAHIGVNFSHKKATLIQFNAF